MQKFDFTAPASGAPQVVNAQGRYLKYTVGTAGGNDTGLILTASGKPGSKILLYPGQAITLPDDGHPAPGAWTIANALGQATITGTLVIGNGRLDDNTMYGTVQVVDGGKNRTLAGMAFSSIGGTAAVASQYCRVQLWNPAANTKRAVLEGMTFSAISSNCTAQVIAMTAAITTPGLFGTSKLLGGAASTCEVYYDTTVTGATSPMMQIAALQSTQAQIRLNEPVVIPPGNGLTIWSTVANCQTTCGFEWYEEPNV